MSKRYTYLNWYKDRMGDILDAETYSFMSSSVSEPWDLIQKHKTLLGEHEFDRRFFVSNAYGLPSLVERIAGCYNVPACNILPTQGVTSAIFLLTQALTQPGDHVVVETPGYEPLHLTAKQCNTDVGYINRPLDGPFDLDEFERVLRSNTRLIILTTPHNPSGQEVSTDEIIGILQLMERISPDSILVVDEIYRDFVPGKNIPACMIDDRIITVSSLTKVYGLSLLRCGWIISSPKYLDELRRVQILMSGIGSRYLEALSTLVFDHIEEYRFRTNAIVNTNKAILRKSLLPLFKKGCITGVVPDHGCISFLRVENVSDTRELTNRLEKEFRLFCVPGEFFGDSRYIRIGIGEISPDRLKKALTIFEAGVIQFMDS